jgi:hypothetical protein
MNIIQITLKNLIHEAHFTFHKAILAIVDKYSAAMLGISALFLVYEDAVAKEDLAIDVVRKSQFSNSLDLAEEKRDGTFRGLSLMVEASVFHYDEAKKEAGKRLKLVFNHYGNIAKEQIDAETGSIRNLAGELKGSYMPELTALGLVGWVEALEQHNEDFVDLMSGRNAELATKTKLKMLAVRKEVDDAYKAIIRRVDSLMEVNGPAAYQVFVDELNQHIERSKQIIAQRQADTGGNTASETGTGTGEEITPQPL